jgi:maltooligosyltrehalose trehalohydrolase
MSTLMLLVPGTPMLFQGQEFAASAPFLYFADHNEELAKLVRNGRGEFLAQFPSIGSPEMKTVLAPPHARATFERCKLDFAERDRHAIAYRLVRDLLRLRRDDPVFRAQRHRGVDGAVLGEQAFVLRFFGDGDRLLLVNLGRDLRLAPMPEPLMAPPAKCVWRVLFSTEDPKYGGCGTGLLETQDEGWRIPGEAAFVLLPEAGSGTELEVRPPRKRRIVY